jgi:hypothetical protein
VEPNNIVPLDPARRAPVARLPVPASIFDGRAEPPFVLFNAAGGIAALAADRTVFVSPGDAGALREYLLQHLPALTADARLAPADRAWALYRVTADEAEALLIRDGRPSSTRALNSIAKHVARLAVESPGALAFVGATSDIEPDAAARAAQTALQAVALAVADGLTNGAVLAAIVVAGVFADAGKLDLPRELIESPEPLTDEQRMLVQHHPLRSAELLRAAGVRAELALAAVRTHHERWDGRGYPERLRAEQLPRTGQYLAVADSFIALTIERPFASPRSSYEALLEMSRTTGQFEPSLLRTFVRLLGDAFGASSQAQ